MINYLRKIADFLNQDISFNLRHCISTIKTVFVKYFTDKPGMNFLDIPSFPLRVFILSFLCLLIVIGCFIFGNNHFGGYDLSMLVDVSYRQYIGQVPYRDFICTLPPMFYLIGKYAFFIFGVRWNAFVYTNIILAVGSFLLIYLLLRKWGQKRWLSILLSLASISCAFLIIPFPWHSAITAIIGVCCVLATILSIRNPDKKSWIALWSLLFAALILCKPNTALPLSVGILFTMLMLHNRRKRVIAGIFAALFISVIFLFANGVTPIQVIHSYLGLAGRAFPDKFIPPDLYPYDKMLFLSWMLLVLLPISYLILRSKELVYSWKPEWGLLLFCVICGIYGWATNWDIKQVDTPLILVPILLILVELSPAFKWQVQTEKQNVTPRYAFSFSQLINVYLCVPILFCLMLSAAAYRMRLTGVGSFYEPTNISRVNTPDHFFENMVEGPRLQQVLLQVRQVIEHSKSPVFFGPRMEFCYAAFREPSPEHFPIWWHPGSSYALTEEPQIIHVWKNNRRKTLIFLKNDTTRVPHKILMDVQLNYVKDNSLPDLTVYQLSSSHNKR